MRRSRLTDRLSTNQTRKDPKNKRIRIPNCTMMTRVCSGAMPLFTPRYPYQKILPILGGRWWCNSLPPSRFLHACGGGNICMRTHTTSSRPAVPAQAPVLHWVHPALNDSTPIIVKGAAAAAVVAVAAFTAAGHHQTTHCEGRDNNNDFDSTTSQTTTTIASSTSPSTDTGVEVLPLWPNGVSEKDIDDLVDEILKDPNVNIKFLPDALERRLYKSTIQVTLNSVYAMLSTLDGLPFLSHEIQVQRVSRHGRDHHKIIEARLVEKSKDVNVKALENVADRLLENPAVNLSFVPDSIERKVYSRCLIVIFRVLTILSSSLRITVAKHDFGLSLQPTVFEKAAMNAATSSTSSSSSSSMSRIDIDQLQRHAESCGVPNELDSARMTEGWSIWDRMWNRKQFMVHLHATLYSLILGILDDLFANTQIHVLSDEITLDIVPRKKKTAVPHDTNQSQSSSIDTDGSSKNSDAAANTAASDGGNGGRDSIAFPSLAFIAGLGIGLSLSTIVDRKR